MKQKICYLCSSYEFGRVEGKVRDMPDMQILKCLKCGLVFLENFDHITDEFYEDSNMRSVRDIAVTEVYMKECLRDDQRRAELLKLEAAGKSLLDFGCGGGGFLAIIKDYAKKCVGIEKDKHLAKIANEKFDIAVYSDISEIREGFDIITLFHVLEHIKDPKYILSKLSSLLKKDGRIIIEVPNADDVLLSHYKCKPFSEFTYWGCHLYMFNNSCLEKMVNSSGLAVDYIKQVQRYPISNHLYWLAKGKPGGHKIWNTLDSEALNNAYECKLAELGICDTIIASVKRRDS